MHTVLILKTVLSFKDVFFLLLVVFFSFPSFLPCVTSFLITCMYIQGRAGSTLGPRATIVVGAPHIVLGRGWAP